jgi:DNA-directed RNA polymerase specialized sigma24 family protein
MWIFKFKRKLLGSESTPTPSAKVDDLLRRHQQQDSNEPHGDPLEAEKRLLRTLALLSDVDQRTREIYIAARSGHSYPEIAEVWGISVSKVKKCVARGLLEIVKANRAASSKPR